MILSGQEILRQHEAGNIEISDFDMKRLNPNSYNLRLHNELLCYDTDHINTLGDRVFSKNGPLDMKKQNPYYKIIIPEDGLVLVPGILYLGRTEEYTRTDNFVPMLEGRSSVGRLGIYIHVTAGFGDVGFSGFWTLEISCVQPVRIYPGVDICQIYYHAVLGDTTEKYGKSGKYQNNRGIQASRMWMDFQKT